MLTRRSILAASAALPVLGRAGTAAPTYGAIRRLSSKLDALIAPSAQVEEIAHGCKWAEGPVWVQSLGCLLFSDPPMNTMYRWSGPRGLDIFLHPSGLAGDTTGFREPGSNGLALEMPGTLVYADSGDRGLTRLDLQTKQKTILVDRYKGKRFNSPNDLCVARSGAIYFTDPPYGLAGMEKSPLKELPFSGVYRWTPDGQVVLIDDSFLYPNGVALSPDETILYVSNTDKKQPIIRAYQLGADGLPVSHATFFDTTSLIAPGVMGMPDGMKIDENGNLFAAGPGGIMVLSPQAELLGVIGITGRTSPNCAFGEDGYSLFIAATDTVGRLRLTTRGKV